MWAGGYLLDLYCDNMGPIVTQHGTDIHGHRYNEFPVQYIHELGSICRNRAKKAGWVLGDDGSALCPKCSGKKPVRERAGNR